MTAVAACMRGAGELVSITIEPTAEYLGHTQVRGKVASPVAVPANADSPDTEFLSNVRSIDNAGLATLVDAAPTW